MTLADHHRKVVVLGGTSPRYLATSNGAGYLVYLNKSTLFAVPFDLDKLETRGTALPIMDDVASTGLYGAQLSFSRTGTLVYRRGGGDSGLLTVAWLDGAGKTQPLLAKPGVYGRPNLSPDGQRVALDVAVTEGSGTDIWAYDWQRDTMTRLTFTGKAANAVWSPDGQYIVFWTQQGEGMSVTRSDGSGKAQPLTQSKNTQVPWSFTPDGKRMAFQELGLENRVGYVDRAARKRGRGTACRKTGGFPANRRERTSPEFISGRAVGGLFFRRVGDSPGLCAGLPGQRRQVADFE